MGHVNFETLWHIVINSSVHECAWMYMSLKIDNVIKSDIYCEKCIYAVSKNFSERIICKNQLYGSILCQPFIEELIIIQLLL